MFKLPSNRNDQRRSLFGDHMRILAVDDEPFIRELLPKFTAKAGYVDVETAASGKDALLSIAAATDEYECFLLDISMPEMNGIELCRHIRSLPGYARTPIIILTAMVDHDFIIRAFQAGATDYATKPFDLIELGTRLRTAQHSNAAFAKMPTATTNLNQDCHSSNMATRLDVADYPGRRQFLDQTTFRNYISQISRSALSNSQVFAVTINGSDTWPERAKEADLVEALTLVGDALNEGLRPANYFTTHMGGGTLLVVSDRTGFASVGQFETDIQFLFNDFAQKNGPTQLGAFSISIGRPVQLSAENVANVEKLFEQAKFLAQQCSPSRTKKLARSVFCEGLYRSILGAISKSLNRDRFKN